MQKQIIQFIFLVTCFVGFFAGQKALAATATLYAPYDGIAVSGTIQLQTITDIDTGSGAAVSKVEYYINDVLVKTYSSAEDSGNYTYTTTWKNPFSVVWDTSLVSNGSYSIHAIVYDTSNNPTTSQTNTVTVSNVGYTVTIPTANIAVPTRITTTHIATGSGTYTAAAPIVLTASDTNYIVDNDIVADGTAIRVQASNVTIDLNGKTITYNQTVPGSGIVTGSSNRSDIVIINGAIIQGAAMSEGDQYGKGNNPISTYYISPTIPYTITSYAATGLRVANVYMRYGGRDVGGIVANAKSSATYPSIIESNVLVDMFSIGTLKNRGQGIDAITLTFGSNFIAGQGVTYQNNTITNTRHRGIQGGNYATVTGNTISVNSLATNSYAIFGYKDTDAVVSYNTISAYGEHPLGIGYVSEGTADNEIHHNTITDMQTTRLGAEYGASFNPSGSTIYDGNSATGIRMSWGGDGTNYHDNDITVRSDSHYVGSYSPTGAPAHINVGCRGGEAMLLAGETAIISDNEISALDKDGTGMAEGFAINGYGIGYGGDSSGLTIRGNTITSNLMNVALGDDYGPAPGWPLFIQNIFVKSGSYAAYSTIGAGLDGYGLGTGKFVSNTYQDGAAETSLDLHFGNHANDTNKGKSWKSIIFGRLAEITVKDGGGNPLANTAITTHNVSTDSESFTFDFGSGGDVTGVNSTSVTTNYSTITDSNGVAQIIVYDYELTDYPSIASNPGPSAPVRYDYRPHTISVGSLFTTTPDSSGTAWDALDSSGIYTLTDANGSVLIDTDVGIYSPPGADITPPAAPSGLSVL